MYLKFSRQEIKELSISVFVLILAFTIVLSGGILGLKNANVLLALITACVAIIPAFVLHEMAHKYVAQIFGCWSEFRYWLFGLGFALMTSFFGMLFAAPGAVYIKGKNITTKQNGLIALAGPSTNIFLALLFMTISVLFKSDIAMFAMYINLFLAGFNMIPFDPLDGSKIWPWNKKIFVIVWITLIAIVLMVIF